MEERKSQRFRVASVTVLVTGWTRDCKPVVFLCLPWKVRRDHKPGHVTWTLPKVELCSDGEKWWEAEHSQLWRSRRRWRGVSQCLGDVLFHITAGALGSVADCRRFTKSRLLTWGLNPEPEGKAGRGSEPGVGAVALVTLPSPVETGRMAGGGSTLRYLRRYGEKTDHVHMYEDMSAFSLLQFFTHWKEGEVPRNVSAVSWGVMKFLFGREEVVCRLQLDVRDLERGAWEQVSVSAKALAEEEEFLEAVVFEDEVRREGGNEEGSVLSHYSNEEEEEGTVELASEEEGENKAKRRRVDPAFGISESFLSLSQLQFHSDIKEVETASEEEEDEGETEGTDHDCKHGP